MNSAPADSLFFVPEYSASKLDSGFRVQFDAHVAAQVPLRLLCEPSPRLQSERDLRPRRVSDAPAPWPTPLRSHRSALQHLTAIPRQLARALGEAGAALQ